MKTASIKRCFIFLLGLAFLLTACGPREIPESKMKAIIQDVFMVNAYQALHGGNNHINTDSVDIYTPILNGYGYDLEDFRHTVDRWALKKSSKLSELIDEATADIKRENDYYIARQEIQDRIDTLINERYRDTVYQRLDPIWVKDRKHLDSLKFTIPAREGRYRILYRYLIDSADLNGRVALRYNQKDSAGEVLRPNTRTLTRGGDRWMDFAFEAEAGIDSLELTLADYGNGRMAVAFRADSVYIIYNEPIEAGRKRYLEDMIRLVLGIDYPYEFPYPSKDSGALHVVPPLRPDTARHTDL